MSAELNPMTRMAYALLNFAAKSDPREYLNGLYVEKRASGIFLCAMNASGAMVANIADSVVCSKMAMGQSVLIHRDVLEQGKKTKAELSSIGEGRVEFNNGLSGIAGLSEGYPNVDEVIKTAFSNPKSAVSSINAEIFALLAKFAKEAFVTTAKSPTRIALAQRGLAGTSIHFGGKENVLGLIMPLNDSISLGANELTVPDWIKSE